MRERFQSPPFREDLGGLNTDGHEDGEVALIRGWTRRRRRDANRVLFSKSSLQGGFRRGVTSYGKNIEEAASRSLNQLSAIDFDGIYYRDDIGYEFITQIDTKRAKGH